MFVLELLFKKQEQQTLPVRYLTSFFMLCLFGFNPFCLIIVKERT